MNLWVGIASIFATLIVAGLYVWNLNRLQTTQLEIKKIDIIKVDIKEFQKEMGEVQVTLGRLEERLDHLVKWVDNHK